MLQQLVERLQLFLEQHYSLRNVLADFFARKASMHSRTSCMNCLQRALVENSLFLEHDTVVMIFPSLVLTRSGSTGIISALMRTPNLYLTIYVRYDVIYMRDDLPFRLRIVARKGNSER